MSAETLTPLTHQLRDMVRTAALTPLSDRELLRRFAERNDHAAFEAVVRRHGPLVLAACRRVLSNPADVEDAFQATFLVLLRKASSIRCHDAVGSWLFGTAHRIAVQARTQAFRRKRHEAAAADRPQPDPSWQEAVGLLHEELDGLPDKFRLPLLLCYLDGQTRDEAAGQLGLTPLAVKGRLERGRGLLRKRLLRRGITLSAGLLGVLANSPAANGLPPRLVQSTARAAAGAPSPAVAALTQGVTAAMLSSKAKLAAALVLCLGLLTALAGYRILAPLRAAAPPKAEGPAAEKPRTPAARAPKEAPDPDAVTIAGKVLGPDGKPHAGARLYLHTRGKSEAEPRAVTDEDGLFRLTLSAKAVAAGATVIVRADGLGPDWFRVGPGTAGERTVRLVKDDVPITGRVLDLEGKPIAGATVRAGSVEARRGGGDLDPWVNHWKKYAGKRFLLDEALHLPVKMKEIAAQASTTTDKEGRFRLTGFGRERVVHVQIEGEGIATTWLRVVTRPKAEDPPIPYFRNASFQVVVGPGKSITGVLRERGSGKPAAGVTVTCGVGRTTTDEKGRFRINGLQKRERYFVGIHGAPYFFTLTQVADTPGLETIRFDASIDRGLRVRGKVTDKETGRPVPARLEFIARADNPNIKDYPDFSSQGTVPSSARARQDGKFQLSAIPGKGWLCVTATDEEHYQAAEYEGAGTFLLEAIPHGSQPSRFHAIVPITIDPKKKGPVTVDVTLRPGTRREGKLVDPEGKPVAGAYPAGLRPISVMDGLLIPCKPLKGATFTAHGLGGRRERTAVFYHLGRKLGKVVRIPTGKKPLTVTLDPMGVVAGRLIEEDGKPITGARVRAEPPRRFNAYERLPDELMNGHREKLQVVVKTDAEGRFRVQGLVPGLPYDFLWSDGEVRRGVRLYAIRENVTVGPGKTKDLGDVKAQPASRTTFIP
jgi:RNA polymerase sigma factor (sigma-70 family)